MMPGAGNGNDGGEASIALVGVNADQFPGKFPGTDDKGKDPRRGSAVGYRYVNILFNWTSAFSIQGVSTIKRPHCKRHLRFSIQSVLVVTHSGHPVDSKKTMP